MSFTNKTKKLMRLISAEREALIIGNYENLASLTSQQTTLLDTIDFSKLPDHTLREIQIEIDKNKRIIKSALTGFTSMREQIMQILGSNQMSTYDQKGTRSTVHHYRSRMERKI